MAGHIMTQPLTAIMADLNSHGNSNWTERDTMCRARNISKDTVMRKIIVTAALPYANGCIHIGHLVEYTLVDIYARYQRAMGNTCIYICADDAHGTAIELKANELSITPEQLIDEMNVEHQEDFARYNIKFDCYHSTHSKENTTIVQSVYTKLCDKGLISTKPVRQLYDKEAERFLADRYVKGTCPQCGANNQYGDNCAKCGTSYSPLDLLNPSSQLSGSKPVLKESEHFFFDLARFTDFLKKLNNSNFVQKEIGNKMKEWLDTGLKAWDISRDAPYFGIPIPDEEDKFFYVWLDAPFGYIASLQKWCDTRNYDISDYWGANSETEIEHYIGKDIAYFHTLFWPAILHCADMRLPNKVICHGFLTFEGRKMSKSEGTLISAKDFANATNPEYLRYYLASNLRDNIDDLDFSVDAFRARINNEFISKIINIASRSGKLLEKLNGGIVVSPDNLELVIKLISFKHEIFQSYEQRHFNEVTRQALEFATWVNRYIDEKKPWAASPENTATTNEAIQTCSVALLSFRIIIVYLAPIIPDISRIALSIFPGNSGEQPLDFVAELSKHPTGQCKPFFNIADRVPESFKETLLG